jgi:hypothetical protein
LLKRRVIISNPTFKFNQPVKSFGAHGKSSAYRSVNDYFHHGLPKTIALLPTLLKGFTFVWDDNKNGPNWQGGHTPKPSGKIVVICWSAVIESSFGVGDLFYYLRLNG